jgi:hypothetical protein
MLLIDLPGDLLIDGTDPNDLIDCALLGDPAGDILKLAIFDILPIEIDLAGALLGLGAGDGLNAMPKPGADPGDIAMLRDLAGAGDKIPIDLGCTVAFGFGA